MILAQNLEKQRKGFPWFQPSKTNPSQLDPLRNSIFVIVVSIIVHQTPTSSSNVPPTNLTTPQLQSLSDSATSNDPPPLTLRYRKVLTQSLQLIEDNCIRFSPLRLLLLPHFINWNSITSVAHLVNPPANLLHNNKISGHYTIEALDCVLDSP